MNVPRAVYCFCTWVGTEPAAGVTEIETSVFTMTVKLESEETVVPPTVTEIGPDVAPEGTVTVIVVVVEEVTVAGMPLN